MGRWAPAATRFIAFVPNYPFSLVFVLYIFSTIWYIYFSLSRWLLDNSRRKIRWFIELSWDSIHLRKSGHFAKSKSDCCEWKNSVLVIKYKSWWQFPVQCASIRQSYPRHSRCLPEHALLYPRFIIQQIPNHSTSQRLIPHGFFSHTVRSFRPTAIASVRKYLVRLVNELDWSVTIITEGRTAKNWPDSYVQCGQSVTA